MTQYKEWFDKNSKFFDGEWKGLVDGVIRVDPIAFSEQQFLPQLPYPSSFYNINKLGAWFEEETGETENSGLHIFEVSDQPLSDMSDFLYFAASSQLTTFKKQVLKQGFEGGIDLGIDPYGLGLWESKLYSQTSFADAVDDCDGHRIFRVSSLPYQMAGATSVQEISIVLASLLQLIQDWEGFWTPEEVLSKTSIELALDSHVVKSVSKIRALRYLLAQFIEGHSLKVSDIPIFSIASPRCLASREPWNNLLRFSLVTAAAKMGGASGVVNIAYDFTGADEHQEFSRNMEVLLEKESFLGKAQDPSWGAYSFDQVTQSLTESGWQFFVEIQEKQGLTSALRAGWIQDEINQANDCDIQSFLKGEKVMTGVNHFPLLEPLNTHFPIPQGANQKSIEDWWINYQMEESPDKLCDVEPLPPLQLSRMYEDFQFRVDKVRQRSKSRATAIFWVEPGLEKSEKFVKAKRLLNICGLETQTSAKRQGGESIFVVVGSDPTGDFVEQSFQEMSQNKDCLWFWAGEKNFSGFHGFLGAQTNLLETFSQIVELLEAE